jgi:hypothetical protein
MGRQTLNDRFIKSRKPAKAGQRYEVRDAIVPGLALRVTDRGAKSFVLVMRYPGSENPTRRTLGTYGSMTLGQARTKARHWLELVGRGVDPHVETERRRLAEQRKQAGTFANLAEAFIREKLSTAAGTPNSICAMNSFPVGASVPLVRSPPTMLAR